MTDWLSTINERLDRTLLDPVVRDSLQRPEAVVTSFATQPVEYTNVDPDRRSLLRVAGEATDAGTTVQWSLVLKAFRRPADAEASVVDDPAHYEYWEREPRFFESGLWSEVTEGIRSVRCHGIHRWPDNEVWLWLEHLADSPDGH